MKWKIVITERENLKIWIFLSLSSYSIHKEERRAGEGETENYSRQENPSSLILNKNKQTSKYFAMIQTPHRTYIAPTSKSYQIEKFSQQENDEVIRDQLNW